MLVSFFNFHHPSYFNGSTTRPSSSTFRPMPDGLIIRLLSVLFTIKNLNQTPIQGFFYKQSLPSSSYRWYAIYKNYSKIVGDACGRQKHRKKLRSYKVKKDWGLKECFKRIGISTRYLADMEHGDKVPKLKTFMLSINTFNASADVVFQDNGDSVRRPKTLPTIIFPQDIRLPSNSTSRWIPLPMANAFCYRARSGLSPPNNHSCRTN